MGEKLRSAVPALAAAAAVLLALSACGGDGGGSEEAAEPPAADGDSGDSESTGTGLDFETRTVDGDDFEGASLQGEPAVLWFWAPWCTVCRGEAEDVANVAARYEGEVEFYGVAGRGEVDAMREFVSDTGMEQMTHIVDEDGGIWSGFDVTGQPSFSFVRPHGTHLTVSGTLAEEEIDGYIADELLDAGQDAS
ncbi:thiol-disulfide isomerase/thioredoxin [Lipingzhangella halophila]|uniref:Thiol-disulfide isomerase/thioredoxin n=1 Tax=Lipingzhangella halophila TaxID=1783352 RepID=A0A7W7W1B9_9ACTN|nr:redoxin domain-containing protein [Lipingzhangella halophila]MBB4929594.1 thiol-disulfide isomerase/thioredoxin [Lipingzhangella halophila]